MRTRGLILRACALLTLALGALLHVLAQQAAARPVVYVAAVDGVIDMGQVPYLQRVLSEAEKAGAAAVLLEVNTLGGRLDAAVQIRDALLGSKVRTIAFVNRRAISAGALITLASGTIAMAEGATVGAATPVQMGQPGGEAAPAGEKAVSYVRKEFAATAEARKRPVALAEAMVDADVEIGGVVAKGKLLTLSTEEALRLKFADFRAGSAQEALRLAGLSDADLRRVETNWAENVVRFLTHPMVSSLLISVGMLGIFLELRTPGFGLPGIAGVLSLGLFFWGHALAQLAGWEELLLLAAGVVLLALELLVFPGFGIAGVLGLLALAAGLVLSMAGAGAAGPFLVSLAARVVFSLLAAIAVGLFLLRFMTRLPWGRRLVLQTGLPAAEGYASAPERDRAWLGRQGRALAMLRPAGFALIDGERVDVVSDGEPIEAGTAVEVVRVDGNRIVVRRAGDAPPNQGDA
ncbi:MAG TPA: NfeD family protein [Ramlibacter sp.]|nr:NfeD family protein [Ramlibacter sp.]